MGVAIGKAVKKAIMPKTVVKKEVHHKEASGKVAVSHADGSEKNIEESLGGVLIESGPPATVNVTIGLTRNLGNYESLRFSVSATIPCENNGEAMTAAYDYGRGWVDEKINALNTEAEELKG